MPSRCSRFVLVHLAAAICLVPGVRTPANPQAPFPTQHLLPKEETGAARFLQQHPEYDGRGVVVAVLDTGVDPGAPGLQTTTDGRPKIVDLIDTTGSGDVLMSVVKRGEDGTLAGATGRTLKTPAEWTSPSGEYLVGFKAGYELFPTDAEADPKSDLVVRTKAERREPWDAKQREREAALRREISAWDDAHPKPTAGQRKEREELQARLDVLLAAQAAYDDPGPIYDCLVFNDGSAWRAAVDTNENGDFSDETLLTNYRDEHRFASFGEAVQLNFSVNIYEEGKRLSIVSVSGDHGTHVAGILAAHHADDPARNGLAPGAQIVSIKIGDSRLGGMETGTALTRAIAVLIERGCDLINMSFGEESAKPDDGRLVKLFSEAVLEHNVIFVSSAGNSGPALSTVGAPGGTTSAMIGVGAYVSPEMMAVEYALRDPLPGLPYTWTSRGPTSDGDFGVDIFAPGGAVTSVPPYLLQPSLRMNGTSMASPNACGGIALLLSAMKAEHLVYTPESVRRALQNTATPVEGVDPSAQGRGLLQVDRAYEHLKQFAGAEAEGLALDVRIPDRDDSRGIYLREPWESDRVSTFDVDVAAKFPRSAPQTKQLELELPLILTATADWIDVGQFLLVTNGGASFEASVDPRQLPLGVHFAQIEARDPALPQRGPLFRVPVTVVRATPLDSEKPYSLSGVARTHAGEATRTFLHVPAGATWADLRLRLADNRARSEAADNNDGRRTYLVHTLQLAPGQSFEALESKKFVDMGPGGELVQSIPVHPGRTLEICLAQYWSSLGRSELAYEVTFRGLQPADDPLTLPNDGSATAVEVTSHLRRERCNPRGSLTTWRELLRPSRVETTLLTAERDLLPDNRQMRESILTYEFSQSRTGQATIRIPKFEGLLYESSIDSERWMLFDKHRRLIAADDMFADPISLEKGSYVLRLSLRHTQADVLDTLKATVLAIDHDLPRSISIAAFAAPPAQGDGEGAGFDARYLDPGATATVWFTGPADDEIPDEAKPGDLLLGTIAYTLAGEGLPGARQRPDGFPVQFAVPPPAEETEKPGAADDKPPEKTAAEKYAEQLLAFKLKQLSQLSWPEDRELVEQLSAEILAAHPADRRVRVARLHLLDDDEREQRLPEVVSAADAVIKSVKRRRLARYFGAPPDAQTPREKARRAEREAERTALIDALYRKGRALGFMELPEVVEQHPLADPAAHDARFEQTFRELARWVDTTDETYFKLHVRRDRRQGRFGLALQQLEQHIEPSSEKSLYEKRRDLYGELGWQEWRDYEQQRMLLRFPTAYAPF